MEPESFFSKTKSFLQILGGCDAARKIGKLDSIVAVRIFADESNIRGHLRHSGEIGIPDPRRARQGTSGANGPARPMIQCDRPGAARSRP